VPVVTADSYEALKAALQALYDEQNGPPLIERATQWQAAMDRARALLADEEISHGS
jgi:hypothetical protein